MPGHDQSPEPTEHVIDVRTRNFFTDAVSAIESEERLESHLARLVEAPFETAPAEELITFLNSPAMASARAAVRRIGEVKEQ